MRVACFLCLRVACFFLCTEREREAVRFLCEDLERERGERLFL